MGARRTSLAAICATVLSGWRRCRYVPDVSEAIPPTLRYDHFRRRRQACRAPLVLLLLPTLLAGCVASGPRFSDAPPPQSGKALLYIYRPFHFGGGGRDAKIFIDGQYAFDLPAGGYTFLYLDPGRHEITQEWHDWSLLDNPEMRHPLGIFLNVVSGEIRYIRFEAATRPADIHSYWFEWIIVEPPASIARQEITQQKFIGLPPTR